MPDYTCERCLKEFSQKSHYDKHRRRKTPCDNNTNKMKQLEDEIILLKTKIKYFEDNIQQIVEKTIETKLNKPTTQEIVPKKVDKKTLIIEKKVDVEQKIQSVPEVFSLVTRHFLLSLV